MFMNAARWHHLYYQLSHGLSALSFHVHNSSQAFSPQSKDRDAILIKSKLPIYVWLWVCMMVSSVMNKQLVHSVKAIMDNAMFVSFIKWKRKMKANKNHKSSALYVLRDRQSLMFHKSALPGKLDQLQAFYDFSILKNIRKVICRRSLADLKNTIICSYSWRIFEMPGHNNVI